MGSRISKQTPKTAGSTYRQARVVGRGRGDAVGCLLAILLASMLGQTLPARAAEPVPLYPAVALNPTQAPAGVSVTVQPEITDSIARENICSIFWDGDIKPAATFSCGTDSSNAFASADIPAQGPPGKHQITVTCGPRCSGSISDRGWQATAVFLTLSTVPDFHGLSYADAKIRRQLDEAGLRLGTETGSTDPSAVVISQTPERGAAVQPDTAVDLVFELTQRISQLVTVPPLLNLTPDDAATLLTAKHLILGTVTGTGRIVRQAPLEFSLVAPGTRINVLLAQPVTQTHPVVVPDLTGLTAEDAARLLAAHRLKLGDVTGTGGVIRQDPPAQSDAAPFSLVNVTLDQRQSRLLVTVPRLIGLTEPDAARLLDAYPLTLGAVTGSGRVSRQLPDAGNKVPRGTAVALTLTVPSPGLVTVPDIRGLHLADATKTITDDGLKLDSGGATAGVVANQRPAPGGRVPLRSTVTATIGQPAVVLPTSHSSTPPWAAIEIALLALAVVLISTAGWLTRARRGSPQGRKASHRGAELPAAARHIDVRSRVSPPHLKTTTVGSNPSPVRITVQGRDRNIKVKEVQK
jgi:beta-lactam-binding protein with PASTA domain